MSCRSPPAPRQLCQLWGSGSRREGVEGTAATGWCPGLWSGMPQATPRTVQSLSLSPAPAPLGRTCCRPPPHPLCSLSQERSSYPHSASQPQATHPGRPRYTPLLPVPAQSPCDGLGGVSAGALPAVPLDGLTAPLAQGEAKPPLPGCAPSSGLTRQNRTALRAPNHLNGDCGAAEGPRGPRGDLRGLKHQIQSCDTGGGTTL